MSFNWKHGKLQEHFWQRAQRKLPTNWIITGDKFSLTQNHKNRNEEMISAGNHTKSEIRDSASLSPSLPTPLSLFLLPSNSLLISSSRLLSPSSFLSPFFPSPSTAVELIRSITEPVLHPQRGLEAKHPVTYSLLSPPPFPSSSFLLASSFFHLPPRGTPCRAAGKLQ